MAEPKARKRTTGLATALQIGDIAFAAPVLLAPLSGVTDAPMRQAAARWGAPATVSEMVASEWLARGDKETLSRASAHGEQGPFILQLAGRDPKWMKLGAEIANDIGADIIDINMGCPAKRVTGGLSGAALMRDLDLAEQLISATLDGAGRTPVTLKMRLGWSPESLNSAALAERAERLGVSMVTVHGRTRDQFYSGKANWKAVASVTSAVSLPVIVNGDIVDIATAREAIEQSGAVGVMIGRGSIGCSWLPAAVAHELTGQTWTTPSLHAELTSLMQQTEASFLHHGKTLGLRMMRKHFSAWLSRCRPNMLAGFATSDDWSNDTRALWLQGENAGEVLADLQQWAFRAKG
jgi:nifR3 family TIM-barrel protein